MAGLNDRVTKCSLGLGPHQERVANHPESDCVAKVVGLSLLEASCELVGTVDHADFREVARSVGTDEHHEAIVEVVAFAGGRSCGGSVELRGPTSPFRGKQQADVASAVDGVGSA